MQPTSSTPTDHALWAQACALVREAGPVYVQEMARNQIVSPIAAAVLITGQLGASAPEQAIVDLLKRHPLLWQADDGSEERRAQLRQFLSGVRDALEKAGPAVLAGLGKGPAVQRPGRKANAETNASAMEKAARNLDDRTKRLLTMIRNEPEKAAKSARTHLTKDVVPWHNALTFMALKAPTPELGNLMVLTADVLRQQALEQVFTDLDLRDIAALSTGVWLRGQHEDQTELRLRAADKLGELLDTPDRRGAVVAVLSTLTTKARIPEADPALEERAEAAQRAIEPWTQLYAEQMSQQRFSSSGVEAQVAERLQQEGWQDGLSVQDWATIARVIPEGYAPSRDKEGNLVVDQTASEAMGRLLPRMESLLLAQVTTEAMNEPKDPEPSAGMSMFGSMR